MLQGVSEIVLIFTEAQSLKDLIVPLLFKGQAAMLGRSRTAFRLLFPTARILKLLGQVVQLWGEARRLAVRAKGVPQERAVGSLTLSFPPCSQPQLVVVAGRPADLVPTLDD